MKKTVLLFLALVSMKVFAVSPDYDSKTHIVSIPKVTVTITGNDDLTTLYKDVEILLKPGSTWSILKATPLDIEFTDDDIKDAPDLDSSTSVVFFPKVTVDKKEELTVELLLPAGGAWKILSADPVSVTTPTTTTTSTTTPTSSTSTSVSTSVSTPVR